MATSMQVADHRGLEGALIAQVSQGNEGAMGEFYEAYGDRVLAFIYSRTGVWEDAEEITLEVFLSAFQASSS